MFRWISKLFGMRTYTKALWFVEGYESEHQFNYETGHMTGPFKTEQNAIDYAKKHYEDGLWSAVIMWRP